jgi:5-methylcytosine-specific restriction endonuclease McrA
MENRKWRGRQFIDFFIIRKMIMSQKKKETETGGLEKLAAGIRRERELREKSYRERALKLFPHVCAKCGREFSGKKLKELTVHHRDHDHDNNPPDGSNWELLCIYCHDNEHSRDLDAEWYGSESHGGNHEPGTSHRPFSSLAALLDNKKQIKE